MKDKIYLVLFALAGAGLAQTFFYFAGQDAFDILATITLAVLLADNIRLRRERWRNISNSSTLPP